VGRWRRKAWEGIDSRPLRSRPGDPKDKEKAFLVRRSTFDVRRSMFVLFSECGCYSFFGWGQSRTRCQRVLLRLAKPKHIVHSPHAPCSLLHASPSPCTMLLTPCLPFPMRHASPSPCSLLHALQPPCPMPHAPCPLPHASPSPCLPSSAPPRLRERKKSTRMPNSSCAGSPDLHDQNLKPKPTTDIALAVHPSAEPVGRASGGSGATTLI